MEGGNWHSPLQSGASCRPVMPASLRRQLLHLATDLAELVENPSDLPHGFDLLTRSYTTPAIAPLVAERYLGVWPSQAELLALPAESLGHRCATWFANAGGQPLPDPVLAPGTDGDTWLQQRVRRTHDVWHMVSGCPPTPAGEAALSAINVMQLRWPGSAMFLGADLLHRCLAGPAADEPDVALTTAFGLELGAVSAPLLAQRWEEGWHRPLADWRERLGIAALVARSPSGAREGL